jgi:hypothetical protein
MEIPDPEPVPFAEQNAVHEGVVQHWNPGGDVAEQINGGDTPTPAKPPLRDISIGDVCRYCGPPGGVNVSCWGRDLHVLDSSHRYSHPPSASNEAAPMSIDLKKVWVTTAQAACALGISTKTLSRCCNEGCFKLGKHYRIVSGSNPLNSRYRWHHDRCKAPYVPGHYDPSAPPPNSHPTQTPASVPPNNGASRRGEKESLPSGESSGSVVPPNRYCAVPLPRERFWAEIWLLAYHHAPQACQFYSHFSLG